MIDLKETHDEHEADRLRTMLAAAEVHQKCRFAMVTLGPEAIVLSTSDAEISTFQKTVFACFARAAFDQHTAFHAGIARGISEVCRDEFGNDHAEWPAHLDEAYRASLEKATHATLASVELTRVAMAPFGLQAAVDGETILWAKPEALRDAEPAADGDIRAREE
jgi:hypothetical protein